MISILEYAQLSGAIYHPNVSPYYGLLTNRMTRGVPLPTNKKYNWVWVMDVDPFMCPANACYAALALKIAQDEVVEAVIVVRGTEVNILSDLIEDYSTWHADVFRGAAHSGQPSFSAMVANFVPKALQYLQQYFPDFAERVRLTITGHSLGGALAQILTLTAMPLTAVAFNSPGCGDILGVDLKRASLVYNINSRYGFINKIGKLVGHIIWVDVPEEEQGAKLLYEQYHLNDQLRTLFDVPDDDLVRMGLMLQTTESVLSLPNAKKAVEVCEVPNNPWHTLFQKEFCQMSVAGKAVSDIILAQHSINHLVMSLQHSGGYGVIT